MRNTVLDFKPSVLFDKTGQMHITSDQMTVTGICGVG